MRGSIQFVASLFALLLIIANGLLWVTRRADAGPRSVVIKQTYLPAQCQLIWVVPGTKITRPLSSSRSLYMKMRYQSRDDKWLYWSMSDDNIVTVGLATPRPLYRVRINGDRPQLVASLIHNSVYFSPNNRWIIFEKVDGFTSSLVRLRTDGQQPLNLTESFEGRIKLNLDEQPYFAPTQISPDSQWVYFTAENKDRHQQIFRVPMAGGPTEALTSATDDYRLAFWPAEFEWPIVLHDHHLYWMRPDGGEFRRVLPVETPPPATDENIAAWSPAEQLLVIHQDDGMVGVRLDETEPLWQVRGSYHQVLIVGNWLVLVGGGIARMRLDGSDYLDLGQQGHTVTVTGLSMDEAALLFYAERASGVPNYAQEARLSDGRIQGQPRAVGVTAFDLIARMDWDSAATRQVLDLTASTNLQPYHASEVVYNSDIVAIGPPIDRKLYSFPHMLISGGLLAFGLAPSARRFIRRR